MDEQLRTSAAHVLVDPFDDLTLDAQDSHHLTRALRLRDGEIVTATDGAGRWRRCRWRGHEVLEADGPVHEVTAPTPAITIGFAPVKGDRPEWTVQKLTELGVDRIVPLRAERSVVRWDGEDRLDRLRRVAREASMQSRRCHVPRIDPPATPADVDGALAQFGGAPVSLDHPVVMIGPEGGWSPSELAMGRPLVALGPLVLRAETAAVVAGVLLTALRDGRQ